MKLSLTTDDIRLKSYLNINHTSNFTEKSSFYTTLGLIKSHSGPLGDIEGDIQLIAGTY